MRYKSYYYCEYKEKEYVREIYEKTFPKSEKFPFWILKQCSKENNVRLDAIIEPITDSIIGMRFLITYDDIIYLMYFAIDENYRNMGYGSLALIDLTVQIDVVLLCIEKPSPVLDDIKLHRKNFYLRNAFFETGIVIKDSCVEYEFLSSSKERIITEDDLKNRYIKMTKNPLIKFVIEHTFDKNIYFVN